MPRHNAYFSALKYHFQSMLHDGIETRKAYRFARNYAAVYAFRATTEHLNLITL